MRYGIVRDEHLEPYWITDSVPQSITKIDPSPCWKLWRCHQKRAFLIKRLFKWYIQTGPDNLIQYHNPLTKIDPSLCWKSWKFYQKKVFFLLNGYGHGTNSQFTKKPTHCTMDYYHEEPPPVKKFFRKK